MYIMCVCVCDPTYASVYTIAIVSVHIRHVPTCCMYLTRNHRINNGVCCVPTHSSTPVSVWFWHLFVSYFTLLTVLYCCFVRFVSLPSVVFLPCMYVGTCTCIVRNLTFFSLLNSLLIQFIFCMKTDTKHRKFEDKHTKNITS